MSTIELPGSFAALGVAPELVSALESQGITEPFPIQALTIADALAGRDVCGKAKTGSGKTLAFGVPILQRLGRTPARRTRGARRPRGLVLVPTRELARQVSDVLLPSGREGRSAADGVLRRRRDGRPDQAPWPKAPTWWWPRRVGLIDLRQRGDVDLSHIEVLVLDEADRMADMGFMPQVEWLLRHLRRRATRRCSSRRPSTATLIGWSATTSATPSATRWLRHNRRLPPWPTVFSWSIRWTR